MRTWERVLGAALSALALASVVVLAVYIGELRQVTECQASYNAVFAAANAERVEAARQDRAAIRDFLTALAEADQRRDDNPLPTERCG